MESLPGDIQKDILLRLPLRSLLACSYVFRKLKTIICGKEFKNLYLLRSMTRPMDPTPDSLFRTVCQKESPLENWTRSAPTQGVVCLQSLTRFLLCSPITNNVLPLPIEGFRLFPGRCFLGYDEATGVFKVLCARLFCKSLVYTVKSGGERSWRLIAYEPCHIAFFSCAMCIGGVLYYAAQTLPSVKPLVMCFNVNSETYDYNQLPEGVILGDDSTMVNYNGKVALVNNKSEKGEFEICVRNEVSGEWELQQLVIPDWRANVGNDHMMFSFVGTTGSGELVFTAPDSLHDGSESVLHYNTDEPEERKKFKMFSVGAVNGGSYHYVRGCLNHFDSLLGTN